MGKNNTNFRHKGKPFDKKFNKPRNSFNNDRNNRGNNTQKLSDLSEKEIGITEYVFDSPGFTGIIKARFSDFHVNEIDLNGDEVVLTKLKLPEPPKVEEPEKKKDDEINEELLKLVTSEQIEKIKSIAETEGECKDVVEIDVTDYEKQSRTFIHTQIKSMLGKAITTQTVDRDEKKFIKCSKYDKNVKQDMRKKWVWPHEFTHFVVHKENVDTIQAAMMMSTNMGCKPSAIAYAGTKDRRAKTTQWFCIRNREPQRILNAVKRIPNITVGNFTFKPNTIKLGQLRGNRFQIALRQITADESVIVESLQSFKEKGFINYYGLQRFGNCSSIPTYEIGIALLKMQWKEACELILKPRDGEPSFMRETRQYWWDTRDAKGALQKLRKDNKSMEAKLLVGLAHQGSNDYLNALEKIPRNMRLLYLHAYQSYVWNKIASKRIKEFGLTLKVGDLVYVNKELDELKLEPMIETEVLSENEDEDEAKAEVDEEEQICDFKALVRPLSEEDIVSGEHTIFDLVLPLPGHDITYPSNECGKWYEEVLQENDLSSEKLKHKNKKYALTGAYRKVFVKPTNMSWSFKKYKTPTDTLILSDMEKIKGMKEPESVEDGEYKALIIDFHLPTSTYATMALREILKTDTSAFSQNNLNLACVKSLEEAKSEDKVDAEKRKNESIDSEAKKQKCE